MLPAVRVADTALARVALALGGILPLAGQVPLFAARADLGIDLGIDLEMVVSYDACSFVACCVLRVACLLLAAPAEPTSLEPVVIY